MYILGINGSVRSNNQDASACLLNDGKIIAAAEEERFLKIKFATGVLPRNAIRFCLQFANISMQDVSYVVFPGITYNDITRILETYLKFHFGFCPKVKIVDHHMAHAASVFYTSGFDDSMIITADLTGDGRSTTLCYGSDDKISVLKEFKRPDSLGICYSIITQYLGFQRDGDEYKVMGLSAYGNNNAANHYDFSWLLSYSGGSDRGSGNYSLNTDYLNLYENNRTPPRQEPLYSEKFLSKLNNKPRRLEDMPIDGYYKDIAKNVQVHFEHVKDISKQVAQLVAQRKIIGWFQGRMELGARALGSRSILSDPTDKDMKDRLNKYVKFREDFRPFAPSVLEERAPEYFTNCRYAPFMAITYNVRPDKVKEILHQLMWIIQHEYRPLQKA